jgi:hypothetical protein
MNMEFLYFNKKWNFSHSGESRFAPIHPSFPLTRPKVSGNTSNPPYLPSYNKVITAASEAEDVGSKVYKGFKGKHGNIV